MLLDCTQFRRTDKRVAIFIGEIIGDLNIEVNLIYHVRERIAFYMLYDADAVGRNIALLTETEYVDTCTGSNG